MSTQTITVMLFTVVFLVGVCNGWAPRQDLCHATTSSRRCSAMRSTINDSDMMASLRSRIRKVKDRATKLPIVVMDTMLPRQVITVESDDPVFAQLIKSVLRPTANGSTIGMVGLCQTITKTCHRTIFMKHGVEVQVIGKPKVTEKNTVMLELRGGRRFEVAEEATTSQEGWTEARVKFLDSNQQEKEEMRGSDPWNMLQAIGKGRELKWGCEAGLVDRWIELARENERHPGQIDQLLKELGEMPLSTHPSDLAFWVGALINPLPSLGVAMEIRPALLMATTANERMEVALHGIRSSIKHMEGTEPLW